jgi:putative membrane protein
MRLGRLAEQQGHAPALRAFGRTLARDHAAARQQVLPVAKAHGVPATTETTPEARTEYAKLKRMHGWAFDQEFARYMVKDHRKDIADFEKQARHGDKSTRRLAQRTLPTLRKHLRLAEGLARR